MSLNPEHNSSLAATSKIVESCTQNIKEWNEAAARKGCEILRHPYSSFEYMYHCVFNIWGNKTIQQENKEELIELNGSDNKTPSPKHLIGLDDQPGTSTV